MCISFFGKKLIRSHVIDSEWSATSALAVIDLRIYFLTELWKTISWLLLIGITQFWICLEALISDYMYIKFQADWLNRCGDISLQRWGQKLGSRKGVWWGKIVLTPRKHGIWQFYGIWVGSRYVFLSGVSGTGDFPIFYIYIRNNDIYVIWYGI